MPESFFGNNDTAVVNWRYVSFERGNKLEVEENKYENPEGKDAKVDYGFFIG